MPKGEVAFRYCNGNYGYLYPSFETVKKRLAEVFSDNADSLIKSGLITEKEIRAVIETLKTDFQHINNKTKRILKDLVGERKDPVSIEAMEAIALEIKALRDKINKEFMYMDDRHLISAALELKDLKEKYDEIARI